MAVFGQRILISIPKQCRYIYLQTSQESQKLPITINCMKIAQKTIFFFFKIRFIMVITTLNGVCIKIGSILDPTYFGLYPHPDVWFRMFAFFWWTIQQPFTRLRTSLPRRCCLSWLMKRQLEWNISINSDSWSWITLRKLLRRDFLNSFISYSVKQKDWIAS